MKKEIIYTLPCESRGCESKEDKKKINDLRSELYSRFGNSIDVSVYSNGLYEEKIIVTLPFDYEFDGEFWKQL